ncbi:polysaccharide deacetylase family protein [Aquabacterium sp. A7-Y]|uniref:polysaccharide deacetylase family protein n=1 Tax=Aquabacterium sp. A7-Y TaxID=1349605 RepID=UPI00223CFC3C|nr:polysaccharide deacetylase family protein [Aquabacterium sp. A7-Y]MCW7536294.1 polysaccharide deacetylase family protein [Aquabacterium sp. A7-Y]
MKPPVTGQPPVSVLMYHQVGVFPRPKAHRAVFCDVRRFAAQMNFLKWGGYGVISLEQAWRGVFEGASLPARPVVLTFDDGYENFREHAWPILQRHGFPASVFLVTDLIGKDSAWLDSSFQKARLMDGATVRRLAGEGVNFGSHTLSHPRLSQLPEAQMRREIFDSKAALEDLLGAPVPDLCYPYGDYDVRARDLAAEAGYRLALTCIRGAANTADNAFEIPRKAISWGDNLLGYAWKLHMKHARKDRPGAGPDVYD